MLVAFTVYALTQQSVQALPIAEPVISPHSSSPDECNDLQECQTIWNIIWSCLATIFACTWVALHMNIPGQKEKWHTIALCKAGVMVLAMIMPELVVVWAMWQWLVSRRIAKGTSCFLV
jgi:hypothetical protein